MWAEYKSFKNFCTLRLVQAARWGHRPQLSQGGGDTGRSYLIMLFFCRESRRLFLLRRS